MITPLGRGRCAKGRQSRHREIVINCYGFGPVEKC